MLMKTNGDVIILAMNLDEDLGPLSMYSYAGLMYVPPLQSSLLYSSGKLDPYHQKNASLDIYH